MTRTRTFLRDDGETEVEVEYEATGGSEPSGLYGPPENYDPGSAMEVENIIVRPKPDDDPTLPNIELTAAEHERLFVEVNQDPETWEPDDDPDYYRED